MNEMTESLLAYGGLVLFTVVFLEQAGLPLPSAPWLLAAGALSATGEMNAAVALAMSVVACVIADSLWFYVGRRGGSRVVQLLGRLPLVSRTRSLFDRQGLRGLVLAKFLPGLGTVLPPLAGALGVRVSHFLLFDSLGCLLYGVFYIVTGFLFHNQLQRVIAIVKQLGLSALLLVLLLATPYLAFRYFQRRSSFIAWVRNTAR